MASQFKAMASQTSYPEIERFLLACGAWIECATQIMSGKANDIENLVRHARCADERFGPMPHMVLHTVGLLKRLAEHRLVAHLMDEIILQHADDYSGLALTILTLIKRRVICDDVITRVALGSLDAIKGLILQSDAGDQFTDLLEAVDGELQRRSL